jgi:hypothetical protein
MREGCARGEELLSVPDPAEGLFEFLGDLIGRQQVDRALFEALDDTWLAREEIRAAHADFVGVVDRLVVRAQAAGSVRRDIAAMDVLMLFKGACVAATAFAHVDPSLIDRHLDLLRASITATDGAQPLRGRSPTLEEIAGGAPVS